MILIYVGGSAVNSIVVQLTHANMKVDRRQIGGSSYEFSVSVNGTTLTITRIDTHDEDEGSNEDYVEDVGRYPFMLRACLPTETMPDFTSTIYTY